MIGRKCLAFLHALKSEREDLASLTGELPDLKDYDVIDFTSMKSRAQIEEETFVLMKTKAIEGM